MPTACESTWLLCSATRSKEMAFTQSMGNAEFRALGWKPNKVRKLDWYCLVERECSNPVCLQRNYSNVGRSRLCPIKSLYIGVCRTPSEVAMLVVSPTASRWW